MTLPRHSYLLLGHKGAHVPGPAFWEDEKGPEIIMSLATTALFRELTQPSGRGKKTLLDNKEVTNEEERPIEGVLTRQRKKMSTSVRLPAKTG